MPFTPDIEQPQTARRPRGFVPDPPSWFERLKTGASDMAEKLASGPVGDVVSNTLDVLAAPVETAMGTVGGTMAAMARPVVAAGANTYSAITGSDPRATERKAFELFDKIEPLVAYQPQSRLARTALDVAAAPFTAGKAGLEAAGVPEEYAGPIVETAGLVAPLIHSAVKGRRAAAKPQTIEELLSPRTQERPAPEVRSVPQLEAPEIIARRQRAADIEAALAEAEYLRRSPQGRELLNQDLATREPIVTPPPREPLALPSPRDVARGDRAAAIEAALNERDFQRQSPAEYELLKRRLAAQQGSEPLPLPEPPRIPDGTRPRGFIPDEPTVDAAALAKIREEHPLPGKGALESETPRSEIAVPERFKPDEAKIQTKVDEAMTLKRKRGVQGEIGEFVTQQINRITDSEGSLEYKGKEYESAVREGDKVRLKDHPDKVVSNPQEILKIEEKVPFDIPPETPVEVKARELPPETALKTQGGIATQSPMSPKGGPGQESTGTQAPKPEGGITKEELRNLDFKTREGGSSISPKRAFDFRDAKNTDPNKEWESLADLASYQDDFRFKETLGYGFEREVPNSLSLRQKIKKGEKLKVYRAVELADNLTLPNDILPGSYVSESKRYAERHGESILEGGMKLKYRVLELEVYPDELLTYGDPHEFLYIPRDLDTAHSRLKSPEKSSPPGGGGQVPSFQQTPAGQQAVIPGAESRTVPNAPLKAKRAQTDKPLELEQPGIAAKEPGLFEHAPPGVKQAAPKPVPSKNLSPEEIAAADEMRGMLGGEPRAPTGGSGVVRESASAGAREPELFKDAESFRPVGNPAKAALDAGDLPDVSYLSDAELASLNNYPEYAGAVIHEAQVRRVLRKGSNRDLDPILRDQPWPGKDIEAEAAQRAKAINKPDKPQKAANPRTVGDLLREDYDPSSKGRSLADILKSEKGSIRLGPLRMRDGKPVEAPTITEAKAAVDELTKPVSSARLIRGGLSEESSRTLTKTMGYEGAELARLSKAVRNDSELEASQAYQPIKALLKKMDARQQANLVDVLEGTAAPINDAVKAAATTTRIELNKVADRAADVGLQIKNPATGEKYPFQPRENFFPHMFGKEVGEIARDPKGRAMLKERIKVNLERAGKEIDDASVEKALVAMVKASKTRYGHLEMARIADLGDYSKDAGAVLPRYFADAYRRINIAEKFGPDLAEGENLLAKIGLNKGDKTESFARTYFQKVTSTEPEGNAVVKDAVRLATNFQAFSKLGQAVISNLSQPTYTAIVAGAKNAAKGYAAAATKEGRNFADKIILSDTMTDFLKDTGEHIDRSTMGRAADSVLRRTGFSAVERLNRMVAANAGKYFAEETFQKLLKKPDNARLRATLEKMNIDVEAALERGELTEKDALRAGQSIVNRTQFKTDVTEIPLFWASDAGRLLTQFKKFQFKSGQMMKDEVLKEMAAGNVKPFLRAAAILPIAGVLTVAAKDAVRFGEQTERERNIADYLAAVGTFGAFTDAFANSGRQPVKGLQYLAGPTLGDFGSAWEAAFIEAPRGNFYPAAKFVSRQIPVIGPSVRQLFNTPKEAGAKKETSQLLKELGIRDEGDAGNRKILRELGIR